MKAHTNLKNLHTLKHKQGVAIDTEIEVDIDADVEADTKLEV
jgi:divalent metal cation (Fe/Co/Zn/Cd) transporter